jgi:hypothetical protein
MVYLDVFLTRERGTHCSVVGIVQPSGQPISLSHSTGVNLRTNDDELPVFNGAGSSFVVSGEESASDIRASFRASGKFLPRRPARLRMPTAAFALKKNLSGAVASKTRDNEYSTAPLGDSEEASVKSSPRNTIPELVHFIEEGEEVPSVVGSEETGDVFQHEPPRSESLHKVEECECED